MKFENDLFKVQIEKKQLSEEQKTARKLKWRKRWPAVTVALVLVIAIIGVTVYSHFYAPKSENIQANAAVSQEMTVAEQIKEEQIPAGQSGDMGTLADDENKAATEEGAGSGEAEEKTDEETWEEYRKSMQVKVCMAILTENLLKELEEQLLWSFSWDMIPMVWALSIGQKFMRFMKTRN